MHLSRRFPGASAARCGFRYGNRAVSRASAWIFSPGEMIGLVGHSGSGQEHAGEPDLPVLRCVGRVDSRRWRGHPLAAGGGIPPQYRPGAARAFPVFGTIAENIAYGKAGRQPRRNHRRRPRRHAHEFILRLPHGYDSLVGERAEALSGGERQRISIARALLINPRILILDGATSSVDSTTEKRNQKALDNLVRAAPRLPLPTACPPAQGRPAGGAGSWPRGGRRQPRR